MRMRRYSFRLELSTQTTLPTIRRGSQFPAWIKVSSRVILVTSEGVNNKLQMAAERGRENAVQSNRYCGARLLRSSKYRVLRRNRVDYVSVSRPNCAD
jgi:hypothetical protein